jgi:hypothetical protein
MDPADTVDSFSLSHHTPNPHPTTQPPSLQQNSSVDSDMDGQEITLVALARQMQQLMTSNVQVQQQLSHLMSASAASAAPVVPTPSTKSTFHAEVTKLKVATPDPFNGDLAKSEEFLNSLSLYFMGKHGITDEEKITVTLSYMKGGTAGQWSKRKVKQYAKTGRAPSWETFLEDFMQTFSDPDPTGTARFKLSKLKQGTGSVDDYVASFKELMDDTGYNEGALVEMFERGLTKLLVDRIYSLPEFPETLEDWMSQAMKFDRLQRRREEKYRMSASGSSTTGSQSKSSNPSQSTKPLTQPSQPGRLPNSSSGVVPMEVDSSRKKSGPKGVCYRCRQPGHFARDCQSKVDINAMDYDSMKAHFRKEFEGEGALKDKANEAKDTQDFV